MTQLPGIPQEFASADGTRATLRCDATAYPLDAVYAATYTLLDRFYVHIDKEADTFVVELAPREGDDLRAAVGALANELVSCALRQAIGQQAQARIEVTTAVAMSGAMGKPSLDDLASFDFSDGGFEDPLGIAASWDDSHGAKAQKEPSDGA